MAADGSYRPLAVMPARCSPAKGCEEAPLDSLAERARCKQIDAVWNSIPKEHQSCQADSHCELLGAAGNCFFRTLNVNAAPVYRTFLTEYGAGCSWARAGMCPGVPERTAACRQGRCTVMEGGRPSRR